MSRTNSIVMTWIFVAVISLEWMKELSNKWRGQLNSKYVTGKLQLIRSFLLVDSKVKTRGAFIKVFIPKHCAKIILWGFCYMHMTSPVYFVSIHDFYIIRLD